MNILVIGGGGREHAIIKKLRENKRVKNIHAAPGNGGISVNANCVSLDLHNYEEILSFCRDNFIELVVVSTDEPLVDGMVDALNAGGITAFGPNKAAAIIEGSKSFAKELMKKYDIPTADYAVFDNIDAALDYVKNSPKFPLVIKADGLALGKGVIIAKDLTAAKEAIVTIMQSKQFESSGKVVVIEEFLVGNEVSVLAFCDGHKIVPMVSAMDHKRAFDNDTGLNTGGMGCIAPNPFYTADIDSICMDTIFLPTMNAMNSEGRQFKGCLYFGLIITKDGPKVIEYNCRFGDPEAQVILPLLKTDLLDIMEAIMYEKLDRINIEFANYSAACVILASGGYPLEYVTDFDISGVNLTGQRNDAIIYHAGTKIENCKYKTSGGRVLGVTCTGPNLETALSSAYAAANAISFKNMHFRKDIGAKAKIELQHMANIKKIDDQSNAEY